MDCKSIWKTLGCEGLNEWEENHVGWSEKSRFEFFALYSLGCLETLGEKPSFPLFLFQCHFNCAAGCTSHVVDLF